MIIDDEKGVEFIGPIDAAGVARLMEILNLRDLYLMQDALDQRVVGGVVADDPLDRPGTAMVFAQVINNHVPKRYRLSDTEILMRAMRYESMLKRELLKQLHREWCARGLSFRRGATFPLVWFAKRVLDRRTAAF